MDKLKEALAIVRSALDTKDAEIARLTKALAAKEAEDAEQAAQLDAFVDGVRDMLPQAEPARAEDEPTLALDAPRPE